MKVIKYPERADWAMLLQRPVKEYKTIKEVVKPILAKVKAKGDLALKKLALEYDHVELDTLLVSPQEIKEAAKRVPKALKEAIDVAAKNIEAFHKAQEMPELYLETMPGVMCRRKAVGIEKVGLYIPGGTAPLFSTVLMLGIPARLAGCKEIVMCTPTDELGRINPVILYAAQLVGITRIVKV
ncbi:histidinol dehydrogenase, partial [Cytophagales bacterium LB-30]